MENELKKLHIYSDNGESSFTRECFTNKINNR